jgi:integrase
MSVYKRNGHWYFRKRINGIQYRGALKGCHTKRDAEEAERNELHQIDEGTYNKRNSKITFKEFAEGEYMEWAKANKRSWKSDDSMLKPLVATFGKKQLSKINSFEIEKYKLERKKSQTVRIESNDSETVTYKQRAVATVNKELKLLSRIFKFAKIKPNPCLEVEKLRGETKRRRWLRPDEEERLMVELENRPHLKTVVLLALHLGLRRGEIFKLKIDDCDFNSGFVNITETKTDEPREVPMNQTARAILVNLVETAQEKGWEYLLTNPQTGTRYKDLKRVWTSALKDAEIEDLTLHGLRHTFITRAIDEGAPITGVRDAVGHRSLATTNQYAHATEEGKRRAVEAQERKVVSFEHKTSTKEKRQVG